MKKYKHLFFDLDRTLWDFDTNSKEAITDLFSRHLLSEKLDVNFESFFREYLSVNHELWSLYRMEKIDKDELRLQRFHQTFRHFGYNNPKLALEFNDDYVSSCSSKSNLMPNTIEILDYLKPKYTLHVITNGFIEAQGVKMKNSGLNYYFNEVIISDGLGVKKPDSKIFHYAMEKAGATSAESLMIGDDYGPDIMGAKAVGMDQVFFTEKIKKDQPATFTISSLLELKEIL